MASWFMHDDDAVMWVGMALISLVVRVGRRRCAAQGLAQLAARVLFSLAFWLAAARTTYLTAAAALAAGGLRHVPAALLLNPAVLPHTLLLALSLEPWARQAAIDSTALLDDGQAAVEALEAAAPLEGSSWWPLGVCCGLLQLTVALVSCWHVVGCSASTVPDPKQPQHSCLLDPLELPPFCCSCPAHPAGRQRATAPTRSLSAAGSSEAWVAPHAMSHWASRFGIWCTLRRPTLAATARPSCWRR